MDIIDKKTALFRGLTRYYTGKPCVYGHVTERLVSNRQCIECVRVSIAKYRVDNREVLLLKKREAQKLYRKKYPEKIKETRIKTTKKNKVKINANKAAWARKNHAKVMALTRKRQASKLQRTPKWIGSEEMWLIEQAYELAALRTKMFGFQWHVDHVIPLQGKNVSGLHVPTNLQVIPGVENIRKKNSFVVV